jgi:hypothetical protein
MTLCQVEERKSVEWDGRIFVGSKQVNVFRMKHRSLPYGTTPELYWKD